MSRLTPMMQQYESIKRRYPDTILFFRLGDFYEMFNEDARTAARELDLALTARNRGEGEKAPMAGIPYHSADNYIGRLIDKGYKVAICEQMEDPEEASGIVERDVIRVITPGTIIENEFLKEKDNNYLAALIQIKEQTGFAYIDISTGEFYLTEFNAGEESKFWDELDRIEPRELILDPVIEDTDQFRDISARRSFLINRPVLNRVDKAYRLLTGHFGTSSLAGFGCEELNAAVLAAGEILKFLQETQKRDLSHINRLTVYHLNQYMLLDAPTRRNLELTSTIREGKREGSLLGVIDRTITSMGGRLIKRWLLQPLLSLEPIEKRQGALAELVENYLELQQIRSSLDGIYDLERILTKIAYASANARDLASLRFSLQKLPGLKAEIAKLTAELFQELDDSFDPLEDINKLLEDSIAEDPPVTLREGGLIREGYNQELEELRSARSDGKDWIASLQKTERERTGISSLKVGFNRVFGYYLEVTRANLDRVPENYQRKQTLSNSERYITPELKEKEALILGAEEKINQLEYQLFSGVREEIAGHLERIKDSARVIAILDVITSLSLVALENNYTRPELTDKGIIAIRDGRHPVVEELVDRTFVPNDTYLDPVENRFIIITGPNMSGKSTYLRQVALIVLLAQIGSFVPAAGAEIGVVDRIFTRVGASDDLTTGQSTFMIEMNEVANIVNNATAKSLIILDEVGRGTSTYDGLSIAWAVSDYINNPEHIGARALFATHYHELTRLAELEKGIKNYSVLVEEDERGVHFLHKIVPGKADDSYGIEVARLAGLPGEILEKARNILQRLENDEIAATAVAVDIRPGVEPDQGSVRAKETAPERGSSPDLPHQLPLFREEDPVVKQLREKELLNMTPLEALNFLYQLQQEVRGDER